MAKTVLQFLLDGSTCFDLDLINIIDMINVSLIIFIPTPPLMLSTQKTFVKLRFETIDQHHQSAMRTSWLELADQTKVSRCISYTSRLVLRNLIWNTIQNALSLNAITKSHKWAFVLNWIRMTSLESMKLNCTILFSPSRDNTFNFSVGQETTKILLLPPSTIA